MINKTKLKARTLAIRAFLFLLHAAIIKMKETSCSKKSIVIITKKSDHSRVTSMSSLKKVGGIAENSLGKSVHRFIICNDGMSAHFRSGFMFKLLASTLFLEKEISWFYNERHHGKGPMDGVDGIFKNVVFRKANSGQTVVQTPEDFTKIAGKFVPSITTEYLRKEADITEPKDIGNAPLIQDTI